MFEAVKMRLLLKASQTNPPGPLMTLVKVTVLSPVNMCVSPLSCHVPLIVWLPLPKRKTHCAPASSETFASKRVFGDVRTLIAAFD